MSRIRSMTGYGVATRESDGFKASVTVRSLNHRYLDLSVHLSRRVLSVWNYQREQVYVGSS